MLIGGGTGMYFSLKKFIDKNPDYGGYDDLLNAFKLGDLDMKIIVKQN